VRHYPTLPAYTAVASFVLGAALLAVVYALLDEDSVIDSEKPGFRLNIFWVFLISATATMRVVSPGSPVLNWCLTPLFVLVMPGWSLGSVLLPAPAGFLERLLWAPVISLSAQLVALMWLHLIGAVVGHPTVFVLPIAFTLTGAVLARLR
jgi:hypothetical protein